MTAIPVLSNSDGNAAQPVTLAELDASVGSGPEVPEGEIAVRYYSDEALLSAIRLRRTATAPPATSLRGRCRAQPGIHGGVEED